MNETAQREQALKHAALYPYRHSMCEKHPEQMCETCLFATHLRASEAEKAETRKALEDLQAETNRPMGGSLNTMMAIIRRALAGTPPQPCTACAEIRKSVGISLDEDTGNWLARYRDYCTSASTAPQAAKNLLNVMTFACESKQGELVKIRELWMLVRIDTPETTFTKLLDRALSGSPADPPKPTGEGL